MKKALPSTDLISHARFHLVQSCFADAIDCLLDAIQRGPLNLRARVILSEALELGHD